MADNFKIIDSQASITELDNIISKTDELAIAWKDRLLPAVKSVTSEMAKGTPKEYSEALKKAVDASKTLADTQKKLADAQSRLEQIEKNIIKTRQTGNTETEKARVKEIQLQQAREKAVDRFNALEKKEQQRIANAASLYSKLEQKLKSLQLEYRDLAARKEIGIRLTEEESKRYDFLKSKIDKYDTALKAVDGSMGKYQRNVGNYERANNGLGMSLAQITREMPAFTNSVQTGFVALSNNIPIFFDAIGQVKNLNKELQAQGKPTVSVLKQLAGALFSWQTLLSVGVTLLTIYGADIWKWAQNVIGATSVAKQGIEDLSNATKEANKQAGSQITNMKLLYQTMKDETASREQRLKAAKELQDLYPKIFGSMTTEQMLLQDTTDKYNQLSSAIRANAMAEAIKGKISEKSTTFLDKENEYIAKIAEEQKLIAEMQDRIAKGLPSKGLYASDQDVIKAAKDRIKKITQAYIEERKSFNNQMDFLEGRFNRFNKKGFVATGGNTSGDIKTPKTSTSTDKTTKKDDTLDQYKIEQDRIEKLFKVREDAIKNEIELIKKDPFLNPVEKIIKEGEAYDKLIKLNQDYYGALIENAKKYKQNTLDFETSRDIKAGDLSKSKEDAFLGMPGAMSEQIDYVNKLTESTKALNYEEAKNKIINDKRLSVSQREYLLSQLEIDRQIEILENNKRNLEIDLQNLEAKDRTNNLTRQEKSDLAQIRIENEAITNEIDKQNQLKKQNENQKLISDLTPLRNIISDGLQGLGLGEISDEFDNLFTKILDKQSTFLEKFNAGFQLIGEYGKILVEQQTQRHIQELDKQLEYTKNATEQELGFIDKRLEYYSNMEDLTAEQIADRNALEDEARTYREQQEEREKLIAIQKAKAEQRASANKAIIGGLQGAAVSIANLGLPAGLPFAIASTAMGALMAALIMSKNPVPQYFVGRDGGRAEYALTQERGAEAIIDKKGRIKTWGNDKGAQLTWLDEGDSVLTASETLAMKRNLDPLPELDYNFYRNNAIKNIGAPIIIKNADNSDAIAEKVGNRFDKIMNKYDKEHIFELHGQLYSQKGGQIPVRIGRVKQNKIEIKVNKNGRD